MAAAHAPDRVLCSGPADSDARRPHCDRCTYGDRDVLIGIPDFALDDATSSVAVALRPRVSCGRAAQLTRVDDTVTRGHSPPIVIWNTCSAGAAKSLAVARTYEPECVHLPSRRPGGMCMQLIQWNACANQALPERSKIESLRPLDYFATFRLPRTTPTFG